MQGMAQIPWASCMRWSTRVLLTVSVFGTRLLGFLFWKMRSSCQPRPTVHQAMAQMMTDIHGLRTILFSFVVFLIIYYCYNLSPLDDSE